MPNTLRAAAKRVPGVHALWRVASARLYRRESALLEGMGAFAPHSAGTPGQLLPVAMADCGNFFPFAEELLRAAGQRLLPIERAEDFAETPAERAAAADLAALFDGHGSDKARDHDYHHVYGAIFARSPAMVAMLEVGLGTNNTDVVSNMTAAGAPGASLRAFRDYRPGLTVYGADVDRRVLFSEDRIETHFVDQTRLESFEDLGRAIRSPLDLVIDDGLHAPAANLAVLQFALRRVAPGGWIVIEDIGPAAVPVWQLVAAVLGRDWQCRLLEAQGGHLFVVRRLV